MKAEDLMVGDLVKFPCGIDKVCDLPYVEGKGICVSFAVSATLFPVPVESLSPIPLTPAILEKNGFENDFYEDESVADYIKVRNEGYSLHCFAHGWDKALISWCNGHLEVVTDFSGEVRGGFRYVHELQHALKLCGINLEIKI